MSFFPNKATLGRALFSGAITGLSAIVLTAPSWADSLKLEGYYTDFTLQLATPSNTVAAGESLSMDVSVGSLGPDPAQRPTLMLRADTGVAFQAEDDCTAGNAQSMRCALPALQPGETLPTRSIAITTSPDERGLRLLSGYVTAENAPSANDPGQSVDATWVELVGLTNPGLRILDRNPIALPDGYLQWTLEADNLGPSSMISGILGVDAMAGSRIACRSYDGASCPDMFSQIDAPPFGRIQLDIEVPRTNLEQGSIWFYAHFYATEGEITGFRPSYVELNFGTFLFHDSFD